MAGASDNFEQERRILESLSVNRNGDLPPLVEDRTFLNDIADWLHKLWDRLFGTLHTDVDTSPIIKLIVIGLLVALLTALVLWLIGEFQKIGDRTLNAGEWEKAAEPDVPFLEKQLRTALADRNFALAARLRWKIHLRVKRKNADITPLELLGAAVALPFYRLMFNREFNKTEFYDEWDGRLKGMES